MSLHIPTLYERVPVYDRDGRDMGYIVRQVALRPGEAFEPSGSGLLVETIRLVEQSVDDIRYD